MGKYVSKGSNGHIRLNTGFERLAAASEPPFTAIDIRPDGFTLRWFIEIFDGSRECPCEYPATGGESYSASHEKDGALLIKEVRSGGISSVACFSKKEIQQVLEELKELAIA